MGTRGMSYSLQSRDLIADQVETAVGGHHLDGVVVVPGCDKNMPGVLMARQLQRLHSLITAHIPFPHSRALEPTWSHGLRRYDPRWVM